MWEVKNGDDRVQFDNWDEVEEYCDYHWSDVKAGEISVDEIEDYEYFMKIPFFED